MIKIPANPSGQWNVIHNSDKLPDLIATRNLTFDNEGYVRLSKPAVCLYTSEQDAEFNIPTGMQSISGSAFYVATQEAVFHVDMAGLFDTSYTAGNIDIGQDVALNSPINTYANNYGSTAYFDDNWVVAKPSDRKMYTNSAGSYLNDWTIEDTSGLGMSTFQNIILENFLNQNELAIAANNDVYKVTTSYVNAGSSPLILPADFTVTGLAYNNGLLGITTHHKSNSNRCLFAVWDGNTTEANYIVEIPSVTTYSPAAYKGSFVFLDGNGLLWYWNPSGVELLAALPSYYKSGTFTSGSTGTNRDSSIWVEGEIIYLNIDSTLRSPSEKQEIYLQNQPGGVWCYDPAVGLYHRHSPSADKIAVGKIATTSVNTTNNTITVSSTAYTGTPIRYSDGEGTPIGGLTHKKIYYTIKDSATTYKFAETYADALVGTAISLTGTGNNNQTLQVYPKRCFGQSYVSNQQGMIYNETRRFSYDDAYYEGLFFGNWGSYNTIDTVIPTLSMALIDTENRGYFVTSKFRSAQLQDDWQKIFIKHSELVGEFDKIVVKYKSANDASVTRIKEVEDGEITWSDSDGSDTFTTTDVQWENVQVGDEVEFIQGAGSGYLAHITSISESTGTYTVVVDEEIKNADATDIGRAIVSRWQKLTTLDNGIISNDDGFSEITVGVKSKQIQFKVELRGEDIEVEEILISHKLHKPVA